MPEQVERLNLPFQTVETINESRATQERDAGSLLQTNARAEMQDFTTAPSILEESAYRDTWGRGRASYLHHVHRSPGGADARRRAAARGRANRRLDGV